MSWTDYIRALLGFRRAEPEVEADEEPRFPVRTSAHMAKHVRNVSSRRQERIPVHIKARAAWLARTKRKSLWSKAEVEMMRQAA